MRVHLRPGMRFFIIGALLVVAIIGGTALYLRRPGGWVVVANSSLTGAATTDRMETSVASSSPAEPIATPERPPAPEGVDASSLYKNAFVLWDQLTKDEQQVLLRNHGGIYDDATQALFEKIQPIMALLHEAARADYCDWALGDATPETRLVHLPRGQALAKLALWNAAHRMPTDPDGAVEDLFARAQLGRDLSETMIGYLVEISFEAGAAGLLQQHGATLTPSARERVFELFSSPELQPDIRRAMQAEASLVHSFSTSSPEARLEMMRKATNPSEPGDAAGAARQQEFEEFLLNSDRVVAEAEYLSQVYARLPEAMLWPRPQFDAWWKGIEAELPTHPLAQVILPSVTSMRNAADRSRVQRSMVAAGLAILHQGPGELAKHPDPSTSGAFTYLQKPAGFELRSALQHRGAPLRMEFAMPPQ